jgi:HK97 family phage major capsid protein
VYLLGPASQATSRTIWGFPAVVSSVFPNDTALVGAYKTGAIAWVRDGVSVRASDSHEDFFTRRMVALLAEMRAAFAAWQPRAFCEVDIT